MDIGWPEILIIALVILVLFGSRKLPDAARSLGRSMRILKTEVKGLHDDDQADNDAAQAAQAQAAAALPPAPPAAGAAPTADGTTSSGSGTAAPVADQHESR